MIRIDMEMPGNCSECCFFDDRGDYPLCLVLDEQRGYRFNPYKNRFPNCPLKEDETEKLRNICKILFNRCRLGNCLQGDYLKSYLCGLCTIKKECMSYEEDSQ